MIERYRVLVMLLAVLGLALTGCGAEQSASPPTATSDVFRYTGTLRPPENPAELRALTYDVAGTTDADLELVAQVIALDGADIVLLQEVDLNRYTTDPVAWWAERLAMDAAYYPQQGLAVLSRLPIRDTVQTGIDDPGFRTGIMLVALAEAGVPAGSASRLLVANVIAQHYVTDDGTTRDPAQLHNRVMAWLERYLAAGDRLVMGGMFNYLYTPQYETILADSGLVDPLLGRPDDARMTFYPDSGDPARYDYLWLSNLEPVGTLVDTTPQASAINAHRPVVIAFAPR
jgi:hypothetical protein